MRPRTEGCPIFRVLCESWDSTGTVPLRIWKHHDREEQTSLYRKPSPEGRHEPMLRYVLDSYQGTTSV
ncbi:MAG: hypothetical protein WAM78_01395, partial [Candidatus Sulfotelmatobacter sp.]